MNFISSHFLTWGGSMPSWVKTLSASQGCARISLNCGCLQYKDHNIWKTSSTLRFKICSSQDALAWKHFNQIMDGVFFLLKIHKKNCTIHNFTISHLLVSGVTSQFFSSWRLSHLNIILLIELDFPLCVIFIPSRRPHEPSSSSPSPPAGRVGQLDQGRYSRLPKDR